MSLLLFIGFGAYLALGPFVLWGALAFFWYCKYVSLLLVPKGHAIWPVSFAWSFRTFLWSVTVGLQLSWSLTMVLSSFVLKHLHSSDLSPLQFIVLCGSELRCCHCGGKHVAILSFVYQNFDISLWLLQGCEAAESKLWQDSQQLLKLLYTRLLIIARL